MRAFIQKIQDALREKKISPFLVGIVLVAATWALGAGLVYLVTSPSTPKPKNSEEATQQETEVKPLVRRSLDGVAVEGTFVEPQLYGVMIDNITEARPQAGLSRARLVIEAPVEMGITRLFAIYYAGDNVAKIGPVRSARPYFLDYASELGALYLHVGGSPDALARLRSTKLVTDLDQFFNSQYFYRTTTRSAPHNTYTASTSVQFAIDTKKVEAKPIASWLYRDEKPADARSGNAGLLIAYSTYQYEVEWRYDAATNEYVRYEGRIRHKDEDGSEIRAKNVAVVVTTDTVLDDKGRLDVVTKGEGVAYIASEGNVTKGTWKKAGPGDRLRFYDAEDNEASFIAGISWIQVVVDPSGVKIK